MITQSDISTVREIAVEMVKQLEQSELPQLWKSGYFQVNGKLLEIQITSIPSGWAVAYSENMYCSAGVIE